MNILLLITQRKVLQTRIRDSFLRKAKVDVFTFEVGEDGGVCFLQKLVQHSCFKKGI